MDEIFGPLRPAESGESARWVFDALHPFGTDVGSVIPEGFSAYVALAHGADPDDDQLEGEPEERDFVLLIEPLRGATSTAGHAWFAVWEGWGQFHVSAGAVGVMTSTGEPPDNPSWRAPYDAIERYVARTPMVGTRHRRYHLFAGPVTAATDVREPNGWYQAPSLWWPDDQTWIVATEIDFSWTFVGGAPELIDALRAIWPHPTRAVTPTDQTIWK